MDMVHKLWGSDDSCIQFQPVGRALTLTGIRSPYRCSPGSVPGYCSGWCWGRFSPSTSASYLEGFGFTSGPRYKLSWCRFLVASLSPCKWPLPFILFPVYYSIRCHSAVRLANRWRLLVRNKLIPKPWSFLLRHHRRGRCDTGISAFPSEWGPVEWKRKNIPSWSFCDMAGDELCCETWPLLLINLAARNSFSA
jgi:hypothetical protein